jgi:hypothetical protein
MPSTTRGFFSCCFSAGQRCFFSNDLDTLLPNFLAGRLRRKKLVYDTHEFYTEVPELVAPATGAAVWLAIERWIFPKLRNVITVNQSIANAYQERYGNTVQVVRNIPMQRDLGPLPPRGTGPAGGRFLGDAGRRHQRGPRGGRSGAGHAGTAGLPAADHRRRGCLARAGKLVKEHDWGAACACWVKCPTNA